MLIDEAESDYIGLYEIVWGLATNAPDVVPEEHIQVAEKLVRELLDDHAASLFVTPKWPPLEWAPVAPEHWDAILQQPESWASPESRASPEIYWVAICARRRPNSAAPDANRAAGVPSLLPFRVRLPRLSGKPLDGKA